MKEREYAQDLANQSEAILDCIAGKKTVEEATTFRGSSLIDMKPLTHHLKLMRIDPPEPTSEPIPLKPEKKKAKSAGKKKK